jgi:HAT1-interacting factor 1
MERKVCLLCVLAASLFPGSRLIKHQTEQGGPSGSDSKTDGRFHFEGDEEEEEKTVDLLGAQPEDAEEEEEEEDGEAEEDGEPEDDFNAAWEVLELARSLYEGMSGDAAKLKLADTYVALGDVSLETGAYIPNLTTELALNIPLFMGYRKIR